MSKPIITLGATTSHGGTVSEVSSDLTIMGKGVHLNGMKHFCPLCKKDSTAIVGNPTKSVMGKGIVVQGDTSTCGATFIANQGTATIA